MPKTMPTQDLQQFSHNASRAARLAATKKKSPSPASLAQEIVRACCRLLLFYCQNGKKNLPLVRNTKKPADA
jgi:hypothetical protein